jgi:hypothetical protein
MNLRAAQKELASRPPQVAFSSLVVETLVVVSFGILLTGIFA